MAQPGEKSISQHSIPAAVASSTLAFIGYGASASIVHRYAIDKAHPLFFAILRLTFSIPLLIIASIVAEAGLPKRPKCLREVLHIFGIGICSVGTQMAVVVGIFLTNALAVGIFQLALPVVVSIASVLTKTERKPDFRTIYGWVRTLAIIPTVGGAVSLLILGSANKQDAPNHCGLSEGTKSQHTNWTLGSIFLAIFITSMSATIIAQRRLFNRYKEWERRPLTVLAWAIPLAYPLAWLIYPAAKAIVTAKTSCGEMIDPWLLKGTAVYALEWQLFFNSTTCILLLAFANSCAPPSVVTFFGPVDPITGVIMSQLLLDYSITAGEYISMAVVVLSFLAFLWAKRHEDNARGKQNLKQASIKSTNLTEPSVEMIDDTVMIY